ncbi:MAG TPA: purine-nucleoside phosphorylase [Eubacteriaceae bacterium]|nr:purine-nucleoside phosphorylase [Eubacteriaceae bacterium]
MTVHIGAKKDDLAKTVLMPGDPLRAKFIAETFLDQARQINEVRGMLGFTGFYKGKKISVMGSGMGMPSMAIYSYELYQDYDVDQIIRIGSCGSFSKGVAVRDIIFGMGACTNSNFASQYDLPGSYSAICDFSLLQGAVKEAEKKGLPFHVGNVLSSDIFYDDDPKAWQRWAKMGVLAVEMEAAALYMNAARLQKKALAILTVSDSIVTGEQTTSEEREKTFTDMMEIALELD